MSNASKRSNAFKSALSIAAPASYEETKPLTQRLMVDLDLNDPILTNLLKAQDKLFVDFNFKVPLEFRTDFKRTSAAWNMSNKDLMIACYTLFLDRYARTPEEHQAKRKQQNKSNVEPIDRSE